MRKDWGSDTEKGDTDLDQPEHLKSPNSSSTVGSQKLPRTLPGDPTTAHLKEVFSQTFFFLRLAGHQSFYRAFKGSPHRRPHSAIWSLGGQGRAPPEKHFYAHLFLSPSRGPSKYFLVSWKNCVSSTHKTSQIFCLERVLYICEDVWLLETKAKKKSSSYFPRCALRQGAHKHLQL